jgi:hypothetical protein
MVPGLSLPPQPMVSGPQPVAQPPTHPTSHTVGGNTTTTGNPDTHKGGNTTNQHGTRKNKYPTLPSPPCIQPPCTLCTTIGHPTHLFPAFPELHNLIQLPKPTPLLPTPTMPPPQQNPLLQRQKACIPTMHVPYAGVQSLHTSFPDHPYLSGDSERNKTNTNTRTLSSYPHYH